MMKGNVHMKYLISNFKSNKNLNESILYESKLRKKGLQNLNLIICPSSPFLSDFQGNNYELGAQDVSAYIEGSYTGETNAKQLNSLGVKYVLVGHSERRKYFNESEKDLVNKIANAFAHGIQVVLCIGESHLQYTNQETNAIIEKQLALVMNEFNREELKNIIIAYEPIWAIGTGITPTVEEIEETTHFIKKIVQNYYELNLPVLYGGSVNQKNIAKFNSISNLDGFLVGGASLDFDELSNLIDVITKNWHNYTLICAPPKSWHDYTLIYINRQSIF